MVQFSESSVGWTSTSMPTSSPACGCQLGPFAYSERAGPKLMPEEMPEKMDKMMADNMSENIVRIYSR